MGMSVMSDGTMLTVGLDVQGKKVRKKRSTFGFGWLKKAFSLDEEEKRAFEERRRAESYSAGGNRGRERDQPRWLDGRRVR